MRLETSERKYKYFSDIFVVFPFRVNPVPYLDDDDDDDDDDEDELFLWYD